MKRSAAAIILLCSFAGMTAAQRLAVLQPAADGRVPQLAETLEKELSKYTRLLDSDLASIAFRSVVVTDPFNMSTDEARRIGLVIGCDRILILRSAVQRRAGSGGEFSIEAYVVTYLVDSRSGALVDWRITNAVAKSDPEAIALLLNKVKELAVHISYRKDRLTDPPHLPEPSAEGSPGNQGLKLPVPYKRVRPEYTETAALYGVKATVDIEVDIDAEGRVGSSRISRWAGFGLDESVERTVRSMNWRPAMRNGKSLPMRVLLRYNFRKVEKDEEN